MTTDDVLSVVGKHGTDQDSLDALCVLHSQRPFFHTRALGQLLSMFQTDEYRVQSFDALDLFETIDGSRLLSMVDSTANKALVLQKPVTKGVRLTWTGLNV